MFNRPIIGIEDNPLLDSPFISFNSKSNSSPPLTSYFLLLSTSDYFLLSTNDKLELAG